MRDVDRHAGFLPDTDRLVHRFQDKAAIVTHMRVIDDPVTRQHLAQLDQLIRIAKTARRIGQAAGEAPRALFQGFI